MSEKEKYDKQSREQQAIRDVSPIVLIITGFPHLAVWHL